MHHFVPSKPDFRLPSRCGYAHTLAHTKIMNSAPEPFQMFLSMFATQLPTLFVCLVAGLVIVNRWKSASSASLWALLGFGLALILCFAMPIGQTLLQQWVFQGGQPELRMWTFRAFAVVGSVLHAGVYALLLVGVYAGRAE